MNINIETLRKLSSRKTIKKTDISEEEFECIRRIYYTIVDSEDYDSTIKYLSGINEINISDVKFLMKFYYNFLADTDERNMYIVKTENISKSEGFANISIISSLLILMSTFGILIAFILYNL